MFIDGLAAICGAVILCGAVSSILKKWKNVHRSVQDSQEAYAELCEAATEEEIQLWLADEKTAQENRWDDKTAMDIYDVQEDKSLYHIQFALKCQLISV